MPLLPMHHQPKVQKLLKHLQKNLLLKRELRQSQRQPEPKRLLLKVKPLKRQPPLKEKVKTQLLKRVMLQRMLTKLPLKIQRITQRLSSLKPSKRWIRLITSLRVPTPSVTGSTSSLKER